MNLRKYYIGGILFFGISTFAFASSNTEKKPQCKLENRVISCDISGIYTRNLPKKTLGFVKGIDYKSNFSMELTGQRIENILSGSQVDIPLQNVETHIIWYDGHKFPAKFDLAPSFKKRGEICSLVILDASLNVKQIAAPTLGKSITSLVKKYLNEDSWIKEQLKAAIQKEITNFGKSKDCTEGRFLERLSQ
jgi:hypothetical protein